MPLIKETDQPTWILTILFLNISFKNKKKYAGRKTNIHFLM